MKNATINCAQGSLVVNNNPYSSIVNYKADIINGFLPESIMLLTILVLCCISMFVKSSTKKPVVIYTCYGGLFLSLIAVLYSFFSFDNCQPLFSGIFTSDFMSLIFRFIMVLSTIMVIAFSKNYFDKDYNFEAEFFILLITACFGAMLMAGASDLIMAFVAMETLGISCYLLTGYIRTDEFNNEASLKYLVIGSTASAILLYGMSYLYGITGSTLFSEIAYNISFVSPNITVILLLMMIITGIGYKMSVAPFHPWAPDVYQGAPTPVSAFLSVVSKAAGFVLMIRVLMFIFTDMYIWHIIFAIIAILSMFIGNITALIQKDIKRLLAYSSIAQVGYMVIGLVVTTQYSISSMIYYLIVYLFMQMGAWCCVVMFYELTGSNNIKDYAGLMKKRPVLAVSFTICLLSLAGIPITAGFFAKFFVFQAAILGGGKFTLLIIIALINSAISMYYYLNVIKLMVVDKQSSSVKALSDIELDNLVPQRKSLTFILGFTVSAVLFLGLFASPILDITKYSVNKLEVMKTESMQKILSLTSLSR